MLNPKLTRVNIILIFIIILAFILRVMYLGSKSLWLDEAVNVMLAEESIFLWNNTLPPLYFAILHLWISIGKSEVAVRFLSVIFGVIAVFAIFKIGSILYGEKEGLVSAFLLSISGMAINFSQDATYYSLFFPLAIISIYFFLRMERDPTKPNKVLFLVSLVLTFYTHYFTMLILLVLIMFMIWKYKFNNRDPEETRSFFSIIGIFFLLIAPILPLLIMQTMGKAGESYIDFAYQTHISINFLNDISTYLIVNENYEGESIFKYFILTLFLYGFIGSLRSCRKSITFLSIWLFLPVLSALVLTNFISNLHIRYISFVLPAILLISSRGIVTIPDRLRVLSKSKVEPVTFNMIGIISILLFISLVSYPILNSYYNSKDFDWRSAAEYMEKNAEDGSNIILIPEYNRIPFNYYYDGTLTNVYGYASMENLIDLTFQNNTYLIATNDVAVLEPEELSRNVIWVDIRMENKAEFSGNINVFKNITSERIAYVKDVDILLEDSRVKVVAMGVFRDSCTGIDQVKRLNYGKKFLLAVHQSKLNGTDCEQVTTPFEKVIELDTDGLEPGTYTVIVNGVSRKFELEVGNIT